MLAIVLVLDVGLFRLERFMTDQAESWRFKGRWARERAKGAEVLVFGDSLPEFGVLPGVLLERTGRRALNLAVHNGGPATSYVLLRRALDSGARPTAIIVDFMPQQLAREPRNLAFARSWPAFLSVREAFDLTATMRDPGFLARTMLAKALGCIAARHEVRASVMEALRGESAALRPNYRILRRHWEANGGAQVVPETVSRPVDHLDDRFPATWTCDPTASAYVRRFLALAESRRIPVFVLIPPIRPAVQAWREVRDLDSPYLRFLAGLRAEHAGLTVIDGRKRGYGDAVFSDAVHLNRRGAEALSAGIAEVLSAAGPSKPMIVLAPFRDPDRRARGVEDMDESRTAWLNEQAPSSRTR